MDDRAEKFFDKLRDAVVDAKATLDALDAAPIGSKENLQAVLTMRNCRDALTTIIAKQPEEFAGLLLALAASANETYAGVNERLSKLEAAMFDSQDNVDTPLGYLSTRIDYLSERIDGMGAV